MILPMFSWKMQRNVYPIQFDSGSADFKLRSMIICVKPGRLQSNRMQNQGEWKLRQEMSSSSTECGCLMGPWSADLMVMPSVACVPGTSAPAGSEPEGIRKFLCKQQENVN